MVGSIIINIRLQRIESLKLFNLYIIGSKYLCTYCSFRKNSESFVEPKVSPVFGSDQVSEPTVHDFMDNYWNIVLVLGNDAGTGESELWIFHASERETGRENDDGVLFPDIVGEILFSLVEVEFQIGETFCRPLHLTGFGDDGDSVA